MIIEKSNRIGSVKYNENILIPNITDDDNRNKIKNYLKKSLSIEINDILSNFSTDIDNDEILYFTTLNFFLCTNCNEYIHINHIDNHSNKCIIYCGLGYQDSLVYLKEVDEKLKKFEEHLRTISLIHSNKNNKNILQDMTYLTTLIQYVSDLYLYENNINSLISIKKTITNIEINIHSFKGSITILILLERAKLLAIDKLNWLREELKKRKTVNERPTNTIILSELQKELDEVNKQKDKIEIEKEMWKRKATSFSRSRLSNNRIDDINSDVEIEYNKVKKLKSIRSDDEDSDSEKKEIFNYKQFVNYVLKIKFEYQKQCDIPERILWNEFKKENINKNELTEWILDQMDNFKKYKSLIEKNKGIPRRMYKMDTIFEE